MNRWSLTVALLRGEPWPALPGLPGRLHVCVDDDNADDLPEWARLSAPELAERDGISRHAAHVRLKNARAAAACAAASVAAADNLIKPDVAAAGEA